MDLDGAVEGVDRLDRQQRIGSGRRSGLMRRLRERPPPRRVAADLGDGRDRPRSRAGSLRTSAGRPSAILQPSSMTMTRSESCITRSSLCSISRMVMAGLLELADQRQHLRGLGRVHAGGGLVEQQQAAAAAPGRGRSRPGAGWRRTGCRPGCPCAAPGARRSSARIAIASSRSRRLLGLDRRPAARAPASARPAARAEQRPRPGWPHRAGSGRGRRPGHCRARSGWRTRGRAGRSGPRPAPPAGRATGR